MGEEAPSGEDLSYDEDFLALERALEPKLADGRNPEMTQLDWARQVEWGTVEDLASGLMGRTRDLRVVVALARALLAKHGITGFGQGIAVLKGIVDQHWDTVYPELEPLEEGLPPTRTNIINTLADSQSVLLQLRTSVLVKDPLAGSFSYRDFQIASGELAVPATESETPGEGDEPTEVVSMSQIEGALQNLSEEAVGDLITSTDGLADDLLAIDATITDAVGAMFAPDLSPIVELARNIRKLLGKFAAVEATEVEASGGEVGAPAAPAAGVPGAINNRQDAIKALDKVAEYFTQHEPSSPVPLMLGRTKRMISMNFLELLEDLNPDAVSPVRSIVEGTSDE